MQGKKNSILIVGGGTSGWITASLIKKHLGDEVEVRLIESEDIGVIGVGEATVPTLRAILKGLEIDEGEFLQATQGSFKLGIKFLNWKKPSGKNQHQYYHSFGPMPQVDGVNLSEHWLRLKQEGYPGTLDYSSYMNPWICDRQKAPKFFDSPPYEGTVDYTYHVDAKLFAKYLKSRASQWGVRHLVGNVLSVELNEEGGIRKLITDGQGELTADLFIDCTGFQGVLINRALKEPFLPYSKNLLCDRAISILVPKDPQESKINPYTTAHAQKAGWTWNIPLQNRDGTGYVFSSAFLNDDKAEGEFRKFLGGRAKDLPAQILPMRIGRNRRAWVKNCLSVGLSYGFVEPLESSGIGFIDLAVNEILPLLKDFPENQDSIEKFNQYIGDFYDSIRDFLILHYCLTDRDDTPFWQANQQDLEIPPALQTSLEQWKEQFPQDHVESGLVRLYDYKITHILAGMAYLPRTCKKSVATLEMEKIKTRFERFRQRAQSFAEELPDHGEYLRSR